LNKKYKKLVSYSVNYKKIIHINTADKGGGAAKIASDVCNYQQTHGYNSVLLVDEKKTISHNVFAIQQRHSKKQDILYAAQKYLQWQDFFHLSSFKLLEYPQVKDADIIHLHNLHSWNGYFSIFALPELCSRKQVVWTLHDMQLLTGHCAYSFDCEKWEIGCGKCPYLDIYPKLTKDTTAFIWKTKKRIYQQCDMHIVVPSKWLQNIVSQSILSHLSCSLIYNGIDITIYKPHNKEDVRNKFNIPETAYVVLFSADLGINNPFKGGEFIKQLIEYYQLYSNILFVNIGGGNSIVKYDKIWNIPYVQNEQEMSYWYSAADVYVYPSLADNCPLVILEAMACGLPIVTFETGGIPELVLHNETGYVAKYKDFNDLIFGFDFLYKNIDIRETMSTKAKRRVNEYFTIQRMCQEYQELYDSLFLS
jgi:glycosyltransferase involved in cell wall biosynthesis